MAFGRVNCPTLWGNVWLFVLRVLNIFRQKAQNASDVWTQYVQWEHVLAKYQLVSAICCHEHMSAPLAGRGETICRLRGPEGTDPSRISSVKASSASCYSIMFRVEQRIRNDWEQTRRMSFSKWYWNLIASVVWFGLVQKLTWNKNNT